MNSNDDNSEKYDAIFSSNEFLTRTVDNKGEDFISRQKVLERLLENKERIISEAEEQVESLSKLVQEQSVDLQFLRNRLQINIETIKNLNTSLLEKENFIHIKDREIDDLKLNISRSNQILIGDKLKMKSSIEELIKKTSSLSEVDDTSVASTSRIAYVPHHKQDCTIATINLNEQQALLLVFCYLDSISLLTCLRVCRLWRECSSHPEFWTKIIISDCCISNRILTNLSKRAAETNTIVLRNLQSINLNLSLNNLEPGLELLLRSSQNSLRTFVVVDCGNLITNRVGWLVSCYCRHLQHFVYINGVDSINSEVVWSLGAGCRKLKSLIIPPMIPTSQYCQLTNRCLSTIGKVFPHLRILCVGGYQIDIRGLVCIAKCCQQLQSFELNHTGEVREKSAIKMCENGLKQLSRLYLTYTAITPKAIVHFYNNCSNLQHLVIQLNLSVYYPNPAYQTRQNLDKYRENIKHIQILTRKPRLATILSVKTDL